MQQSKAGQNIFQHKTEVASVEQHNIFYKLQDSPAPISSSRVDSLKLSDTDFNNIYRFFDSNY